MVKRIFIITNVAPNVMLVHLPILQFVSCQNTFLTITLLVVHDLSLH